MRVLYLNMQKRKAHFADPPGKKQKTNKIPSKSTVSIYSRLRPVETEEEIMRIATSTLIISQHTKEESLYFDNVFGPESSSRELFDIVCVPMLEEFIGNQRNGGIFTYGTSASGKSHTMIGSANDRGFIPLSLSYLLSQEITVNLQFYEVFNDSVYDLIGGKSTRDRTGTKIQGNNEFFKIKGLTEKKVSSVITGLGVLNKGISNRKLGFNSTVYKPHLVFSIELDGRKFVFIDVAAPVNSKPSAELSKGARNLLKCIEAKKLNSCHREQREIPCKDTPLTSLFPELFLDTASLLSLIMTINPRNESLEETNKLLSPLRPLLTQVDKGSEIRKETISQFRPILKNQYENGKNNESLLIQTYEAILKEQPLKINSATSPMRVSLMLTSSSVFSHRPSSRAEKSTLTYSPQPSKTIKLISSPIATRTRRACRNLPNNG